MGSVRQAPPRVGPSQADLDQATTATDSWLTTNKSYDGHRFVALDQINAGNVGGLKDACVYDTGLAAQGQSSPVLYQGRIYFTAAQTTVAIGGPVLKSQGICTAALAERKSASFPSLIR